MEAQSEKVNAMGAEDILSSSASSLRTAPAPRVVVDAEGLPVSPQPVLRDPMDPLNWSGFQKHTILAIVMALYFMFTYITSTTVPSFPSLQEKYAINAEQVNWTVAIPALGLAIGPLLCSSVADIIGRRPVMIIGTAVAFVATVGAAVAPSYGGYMAARFFQGLGVSPAATVGLAIIMDLFFERERGEKIGLWVLAIDLGLLAGPLIGGFVDLAGDVWVQWLTAILFGVILLAEMAFLPETLYPRELMLTKSRDTVSPFGDEEKAVANSQQDATVIGPRRTKELSRFNVMPLPGMQHPAVADTFIRFIKTFRYYTVSISIGIYCFAWYWWVLSVITLIPAAYETYSPQIQGLFFIGLILGTLISEVCVSGRLSDWLVLRLAKKNDGIKTAEMRLWIAYPGAVLSGIGMLVWGISVDKNWHWAIGQVALLLFGGGLQMGNAAICAYVVDSYPQQSMSVIVFYAFMLNFSAFVDPFFIVPWLDAAGFTWTFFGHTCITLFVCIPVLTLLHIFGGRLRKRAGEPTWVDPGYSGYGLK